MSWDPESTAQRDTLLEHIRGISSVPTVILIDGPSGSGKTSLARFLADELAEPLSIVHMDDLYPGWDGLDIASNSVVRDLLAPLRSTGRGRWQRWDWSRGEPAEWHDVFGPNLVIVEGCGTLSRASVALADLRVWLSADDELRKRRALDRDGETFEKKWDQWQANFDRYVERESPTRNANMHLTISSWPLVTL